VDLSRPERRSEASISGRVQIPAGTRFREEVLDSLVWGEGLSKPESQEPSEPVGRIDSVKIVSPKNFVHPAFRIFMPPKRQIDV